MYRFKCIVLFPLLICVSTAFGQEDLIASINNPAQLTVAIPVDAGTTLYSIARKTGNSVHRLMEMNNKQGPNLSIGEIISAPLNVEINTNINSDQNPQHRISYKVSNGDNLFRISQLTGISIDELIRLNQKKDAGLATGEKLLLGWIGTGLISAPTIHQKPQITIEPLERNLNTLVRLSSVDRHVSIPAHSTPIELLPPEIVTEKGIAYWEKKEYEGGELIVMHPRARLNSDISLYNPMLNRTVKAKVVRELPREAYPEEISVVISPSVASALGALDKRFLVEITYIE